MEGKTFENYKKVSHGDTEVKKIMAIFYYYGIFFFKLRAIFFFSVNEFKDSNFVEHLCMNLKDPQLLPLDGPWTLLAGRVRIGKAGYHSSIYQVQEIPVTCP